MKPENRVIILVGPTCVGKTSVSLLLARALGTEIISSDSMQIYRHMDIGTEKPAPEQRAMAPHHMIDVAEPSEGFSTGRYLDAVRPIIERLHSEGRVPIVTGGTGLYIRAMTRGLFEGPEADWPLRAELERSETAELYRRLIALDPETASTLMPEDRRRIIRALEVCLVSGRKMSAMKDELTQPLPYDFIKIALSRDRGELYRMIDERVDGMLGRGLLEEVRALLELRPCITAMQAIGYKELAAHLRGECSIEEAIERIKRNTRRYAKRQMTWFRSEAGLIWVDVTGLSDAAGMFAKVADELRRAGMGLG